MRNFLKLTAFNLLLFFALFLALEAGVRGYFATRIGPDVFWYGYQRRLPKLLLSQAEKEKRKELTTTDRHPNKRDGYTKYYPRQIRIDMDVATKETFDVTINKWGFRGKDYREQKPPGVIRVVTLGASSTFGFYNRDDETYPYYLERFLNDRLRREGCAAGQAFEVINLGIPHSTATNIRAIYLEEAKKLKPDFVTFYEGMNDAALIKDQMLAHSEANRPYWKQLLRGWSALLARRLLLIRFFNDALNRADRYDAEEIERLLAMPSVTFGQDSGPVRRDSEIVENLIAQLDLILQDARKNGSRLLVASQQAQSLLFERSDLRGLTYESEVARLRALLAQGKEVDEWAVYFLLHDQIMRREREWARQRNALFVDILSKLDKRRDVLVSWVHLSPEGNRMIAQFLSQPIYESACGGFASLPPHSR